MSHTAFQCHAGTPWIATAVPKITHWTRKETIVTVAELEYLSPRRATMKLRE